MVAGWPEPLLECLVACSAFAVFLALHVAWWSRVGAERAGFALLCGLWLLAMGGGLATAAALWPHRPVHGLTVVAVGGLLMAFYLHLYTGMLRSVSLRLLGELEARDGVADRAVLEAAYSPDAMLDSRLRWMAERGLVSCRAEGVYELTPGGRRLLAARRPLVNWLVEGPTG